MKASCMRRQKICDVALVPSSSTLSYHQIQDTLLQEIIYIYIYINKWGHMREEEELSKYLQKKRKGKINFSIFGIITSVPIWKDPEFGDQQTRLIDQKHVG